MYTKRKKTEIIFVHCTATPEGKEFHAKDIDKMHRARGFNGIGYHYIICLDGSIEKGRPDDTVGAHVQNYNSISVGISYIGGVEKDGKTAKDTRTPAQKAAMVTLLRDLKAKYPGAKIMGHRDISPDLNGNGRVDPYERIKECPCFDAIPEYAGL